MNGDLHLDSLLHALRTAGLRVGISETLRLRQVFVHEPALAGGEVPRERLRSLLRAVLVKSAEDRGTFDRVCDAWLDRADGEIELHRGRRQPVPVPPVQRKGFSRARLLRQAAMASALALLLLSVDKHSRTEKRAIPAPGKIPAATQRPPAEAPDVTPDDVRRRTRPTTVATLTVTTRRWLALLRPEMALAVLAWLSTGGLWLALRRRRLLPEPPLAPPAPGPSRTFPLSVAPAGPVLLAPREQEGLIWGIGRFVSEEPTRRLDLPATVRATALAGGLPEMRFHRARFYREVWLWLDEDADDPALPRLAAEIETVLASHGLPVERAAFRGLPHRLVTADGQAFAPNEIDERRDVALVAILTDGRRLVRRYAADDQRVRIDALLRSLSHWPHLAFVDASQGESGLAAILGRHGLAAVAPARSAAFLGGALRSPATSASPADVEGEAAWAAVCALCPAPLDEATALELRRRLELTVSPYSLQALRTEAPGPPGRLAWRSAGRVRRVRWLREAEAHPEGTVLRGSLLDRALAFWENLYDRTLAEHAGQEDREETPAVRVLRMERALLGLWRGTEGHVAELYRLYQGPLREAIEHHLETLAPSDWGGPDVIHLPWPWSQPAPVERAMLREMRFGGGMPPVGLRRPGRAWLGIGLLAGLGFAAAGMAVLYARAERQPEIVMAGEPPPGVVTETVRAENGAWRVRVATRTRDVAQEVEDGSRVLVRWQFRQLPCVETMPEGSEIWRCGRLAASLPQLPGVSRSVVFLDRSLGTPSVERLILDLLDSGSADLVVTGRSPETEPLSPLKGQQTLLVTNPSGSPPADRLQPSMASDRTVWLAADRLDIAGERLRFEGVRSVRDVWPDFRVVRGDPSRVLLRGLGTGCQNSEIEENGLTFVRICPGTFTMGSRNNDPLADEDEMPAHQVTLDEFWMSKYEVTNEQYRKVHPGHKGEPHLPATDVSWIEAKGFCEKLEYRLPTEAEWEYAARAGTETPWSSGSDPQELDRYAWFDEDISGEPHPVGGKEPNPWGLHDLHGNVWEWVEDWYGPYSTGPQVNPTGPPNGERRVLRGGSFDYPAGNLRFAIRDGFRPENRFRFIGFRCVRAPRRQP